jgi:DNA-binding XRE family transcriptional regulator
MFAEEVQAMDKSTYVANFRFRLRQLRLARKWSYRDLAKAAGISHGTIGFLENGDYKPSLETALALARALEVNIYQLLS